MTMTKHTIDRDSIIGTLIKEAQETATKLGVTVDAVQLLRQLDDEPTEHLMMLADVLSYKG